MHLIKRDYMLELKPEELLYVQAGNTGVEISFILSSADKPAYESIIAGSLIGWICLFPTLSKWSWEYALTSAFSSVLGSVAGHYLAEYIKKS